GHATISAVHVAREFGISSAETAPYRFGGSDRQGPLLVQWPAVVVMFNVIARMPLSFLGSVSSPFDEIVESATTEKQASENWYLILEICDRVSQGDSKAGKDCLLSLKKRLNHRDPHVIMAALSVLDSCVSNCGKNFKDEVSSKEFVSELRSKATGSNRLIAEKTRALIKRWCDEENADHSLGSIQILYADLLREGFDFAVDDGTKKKTSSHTPDPTVLKKEEEDLAKGILPNFMVSQIAIQLSLKEGQPQVHIEPLYLTKPTSAIVGKTAKALYDFEAAEDNELTFKAGEFITVTDDSDQNWWRGTSHRGEGLFPASFVSFDLNVAVEQKKSVTFDDAVAVTSVEYTEIRESPKIDEHKLDRCLELLQDTDPTGQRPDVPELPELEEQCLAMAPLIEKEIERSDNLHNQLREVNAKLIDALNLYHYSMKDTSPPVQTVTVPAVEACCRYL
ncbi:unnamed protein product, partial [Soboliphyme baturini]|uniref:Signal transducing adapter molecule 1 n=1 Tax=Soboliphyme baturini TaxID=241478 RepID=A0A183II84_9BILA